MALVGEGTTPTHEKFGTELMIFSGVIAGLSEGRVRVAVSEEDQTTELQPEAAHFLKLDGERLGRDIEVYSFMADLSSDAQALGDFLVEVLLPLKDAAPSVYEATAPLFEQLGYRFIDAEHHERWATIFAEPITE